MSHPRKPKGSKAPKATYHIKAHKKSYLVIWKHPSLTAMRKRNLKSIQGKLLYESNQISNIPKTNCHLKATKTTLHWKHPNQSALSNHAKKPVIWMHQSDRWPKETNCRKPHKVLTPHKRSKTHKATNHINEPKVCNDPRKLIIVNQAKATNHPRQSTLWNYSRQTGSLIGSTQSYEILPGNPWFERRKAYKTSKANCQRKTPKVTH